jgi:hypothetical protein
MRGSFSGKLRYWRSLAAALIALAGVGMMAGPANASALADRFSASDAASTTSIDHGAWDDILGRYLTMGPQGVSLFDYAAVSAADRQGLKAYISALQAVRITAHNRDVQMAYWINLYNALTVNVILDNYPVESIRDISSGLFSSGPWGTEVATVEGANLSLDDIEHEILRPIWRDNRIHYVVNCASIGCPNLAGVAYTASNLAELLEHGARDYINNPRGVRVDNGRVIASKLYDWYADDFGSRDELFAHLRHYADPQLRTALDGQTRIYDYEYDWALNSPR